MSRIKSLRLARRIAPAIIGETTCGFQPYRKRFANGVPRSDQGSRRLRPAVCHPERGVTRYVSTIPASVAYICLLRGPGGARRRRDPELGQERSVRSSRLFRPQTVGRCVLLADLGHPRAAHLLELLIFGHVISFAAGPPRHDHLWKQRFPRPSPLLLHRRLARGASTGSEDALGIQRVHPDSSRLGRCGRLWSRSTPVALAVRSFLPSFFRSAHAARSSTIFPNKGDTSTGSSQTTRGRK